jgi:glutathione peroxidase
MANNHLYYYNNKTKSILVISVVACIIIGIITKLLLTITSSNNNTNYSEYYNMRSLKFLAESAIGMATLQSSGSGKLPAPIYTFKGLKTLEGNEDVDFSTMKGKVIVITNVASKWGFTKVNYEQLTAWDRELRDSGLAIVGVPCNQFGSQEPGTPQEIRKFVDKFGVKFTMTEKVDVNGPNSHPLYVALKQATGTSDKDIRWNFETKFVIERDGVSVTRYSKAAAGTELEKLRAHLLQLLVAKDDTGTKL